ADRQRGTESRGVDDLSTISTRIVEKDPTRHMLREPPSQEHTRAFRDRVVLLVAVQSCEGVGGERSRFPALFAGIVEVSLGLFSRGETSNPFLAAAAHVCREQLPQMFGRPVRS